ncbi:class I tRNA ligase family protein, partial [Candidatus Uhrbacteria bacterium]|nr:class I tRNA ligase family protein [Candidatus Uhrbacteria bacterium]
MNFPENEKKVLEYWDQNSIFQKTVDKQAPKGSFVFYEGPPTANGKPGIHHVESRAFKDCIPRFKTMQGYNVVRKAGWDTHGLPVELEVEKQLGFKSKLEIEEYGIDKFNAKCKESVWKYKTDWEGFTKRMGYWLDLENPYITYDSKYIESLWWIVKQVWEKDLLYKDYRVTPHCPRCGTSLSSHELSQGYKDVKDLSVTARFKIVGTENEYILAWTTTPWTLPGNVGLAVGEKIVYAKVKEGENFVWLAKERVSDLFEDDVEIVEEVTGDVLVGKEYEPLYPYLRELLKGTDQEDKKGWYVMAADFVTTEDGTGVVHTAVMYGADDFMLGNAVGLPKFHIVNLDGTYVKGTGPFEGRLVTDENVAIDVIKDLAHRG